MSSNASPNTPEISKIFLAFLKIGTFAFGGVYSMLSFFEKELVEKRGWITNDVFTESVAIGQITPGAPIVNTGICIGYRLRKVWGSLAATAGQIFTGTVIAVLLSVFYVQAQNNPVLRSALKGIGAAVVGLLISVIIGMSKKTLNNVKTSGISAAAFVCLAFFRVNPIVIIFISGLVGYLIFRKKAA